MILTITIILSILVSINFMLLAFSCNKTTKREIKQENIRTINPKTTIQQAPNRLAPTGS